MDRKTFHLSSILTVCHNIMMSSFPEMREVLDYMTGHSIPIWEIPRARAMCAESIKDQYPLLGYVELPPEFKRDGCSKFVRQIIKLMDSDELALTPLAGYEPLPTAEGFGY